MPEARDRLPRREDADELFIRPLRRTIGRLEILLDEPERGFGTPIRRHGGSRAGTLRRGQFGTHMRRGDSPAVGLENTPPVIGTGRRVRLGRGGSNSVLPLWYPRSSLQDVTAVMRAIERRGSPLRGGIEGLEMGSPIVPQGHIVHTPAGAFRSGAQLEHGFSHTPTPTKGKRHCPPLSTVGKVPKILLDITNQSSAEFLTPQKKLLNSIETVEKVVMEELRKLKRTPSAKKAEREKKVRTLMSMR